MKKIRVHKEDHLLETVLVKLFLNKALSSDFHSAIKFFLNSRDLFEGIVETSNGEFFTPVFSAWISSMKEYELAYSRFSSLGDLKEIRSRIFVNLVNVMATHKMFKSWSKNQYEQFFAMIK